MAENESMSREIDGLRLKNKDLLKELQTDKALLSSERVEAIRREQELCKTVKALNVKLKLSMDTSELLYNRKLSSNNCDLSKQIHDLNQSHKVMDEKFKVVLAEKRGEESPN